jgi:hypothetical protein
VDRSAPSGCGSKGTVMRDLIFVIATVLFFAISIAYTYFCDRVR